MKALLINPPFLTTSSLSVGFGEPLGLAYVAAALERSGRHSVEILDCVGSAPAIPDLKVGEINRIGLEDGDVLARLAARHFDVIGITMTRTSDLDPGTTTLIGMIKAEYPQIPIIIGGPEATHSWNDYVHDTNITYIVLGEGEKTIVDLLDAIEGQAAIASVKGIVFMDADGVPVKTAAQDTVDIDSLAWPARHLLPMSSYIENRPTTERRAASILTSRACPYRCAFCSTIHVWGNNWRGRAVGDVVREIEFLVKEYGVGEIIITDDNFCVNRKRVHAICDMIIALKLDVVIHVSSGVMSSLANEDLLKKLSAAGMVDINMQLESGNEQTQGYICKKIDLAHMKSMIDTAHALGMHVSTNIILGFPFETKEQMEDSAKVAIGLGFDSIDFVYILPKDNTRVHRDFVECGILAEGELPVLPVRTVHCSADEVRAVRDWAIQEFQNSKKAAPTGRSMHIDPAAISHGEGHCYSIRFPDGHDLSDHSEAPMRSPARLYEDDVPLGPLHTLHRSIRAFGEGRYSHWDWWLYFSTSDNSDPRTNGRTYRLEY